MARERQELLHSHILREASAVARSTNRAMRRPLMVG